MTVPPASGSPVISEDTTGRRVVESLRSRTTIAVLSVIVLSTLLRLPLVQWPYAEHPDAPCCGNPDEATHYELVRAFRSESDPGSYPPGLAFLTFLALRTPARAAVSALVPPTVASEDHRDRIRVIAVARILCLSFSAVAVLLLYLICIEAGLSRWLAATSAPLLGLAPLYGIQTTFALADAPNVALLLASIYVFLKWHRRRQLSYEILFGLILGGVFAVKLVGVVIGIPLMVSMILRSPSRRRTALAIGVSLFVGVYAFAGGHMRFASISSVFQKVVVENVRATRIRPGWNAVHHLLSLLPGMGALFILLLMISIGWRLIARVRAWRVRALDPLPAVGIGSLLYFLAICFSSNPFVRHVLPLYPFLILFVLVTTDALLRTRFSPGRGATVGSLLFACALAYNTFTSWPLARSFVDDPLDEASAWVRAETAFEPRVEAFRNFPPVPSVRARPAPPGAPEELMIVHSAWLGRLTGSWWLRPAPKEVRDVYHFDGSFEELRFWQKLMAGELTEWRVLASFGDDWNTPERLFLSLIGRGYDQFVTAGRAYVVARTSGRPG